MCERCKEIASQIPKSLITAIEVHRAELVEILVEINKALNSGEEKHGFRSKSYDEETLGVAFGGYVCGFLIGTSVMENPDIAVAASFFGQGITHGNAIVGARQKH